ncbi:MAG: alpha/beta hydrolase [Bryobacteraceae bacterium]
MFKRTLVFGTALGVGALLLLTLAAAVFCEATLHVFRRAPGDLAAQAAAYPAATWKTVTVRAADGAVLEGWFAAPSTKPSGRCVAVLHGIADSRLGAAGFAPMFLAEGYSVLLPDSRGHGRSGGEFVTYGLLEKRDVVEWAHWMRSAGCASVYGMGESLGASILIQASAVEPVFRAIVAECPFADLEAAGEIRVQRILHLPGWVAKPIAWAIVASGVTYARLRYGIDVSQVAPVEAMARTKTPILLIHGLADSRTPCWHSQRLAQANPAAVLWLVPHANHVRASAADPTGFRLRVLGWFAQH